MSQYPWPQQPMPPQQPMAMPPQQQPRNRTGFIIFLASLVSLAVIAVTAYFLFFREAPGKPTASPTPTVAETTPTNETSPTQEPSPTDTATPTDTPTPTISIPTGEEIQVGQGLSFRLPDGWSKQVTTGTSVGIQKGAAAIRIQTSSDTSRTHKQLLDAQMKFHRSALTDVVATGQFKATRSSILDGQETMIKGNDKNDPKTEITVYGLASINKGKSTLQITAFMPTSELKKLDPEISSVVSQLEQAQERQ